MGAIQCPNKWEPEALSPGVRGWGAKLTTYVHLVPSPLDSYSPPGQLLHLHHVYSNNFTFAIYIHSMIIPRTDDRRFEVGIREGNRDLPLL